MDPRRFQQILGRYLRGEATKEEQKMVDAWYDSMGKGDPALLTQSEKAALEQRYWAVISGSIKKTHHTAPVTISPSVRGKQIMWYSMGIAASLIAITISYFVFQNSTKPIPDNATTVQQYAETKWTQLVNPTAVAKQFDLPDGSHVSLEPNSSLKYETSFNQSKREVFLNGDAHFEVSHNKQRPFLVHANEVTTTVLGTSFRVKAFEDSKEIMVAVQTGMVAVSAVPSGESVNNSKPDIILTPNQQIVYNRNKSTMKRSLVDVPQPIPTQENLRRMRFDEAPVAEIFQALEMVYGVYIEFDKSKLASCVLTTSISDGGIYNRLDIICEAIGAKYTVQDNAIIISGSGCD